MDIIIILFIWIYLYFLLLLFLKCLMSQYSCLMFDLQMAAPGDDVRRGPEAVDVHLRQPGHRAPLPQEARLRSTHGVPAVPLPSGHFSTSFVGFSAAICTNIFFWGKSRFHFDPIKLKPRV